MENNQQTIKLPLLTLLLILSFASVNAVLFTPALPDIARFFAISSDSAQLTMSLFLIGYALGQLIYGPVANRFGRKPALYAGVGLQILSSFLCVLAGVIQEYTLLILGRFLLALGAGVGLNMTITLVSECYDPKKASQTIAYLMVAFAITPGLSVALGGVLNTYYGWMSCFYASAFYGMLLLLLLSRLPETLKIPDLNALKVKNLLRGYGAQFKNFRLIATGLLMGCTTCFVYVFAAVAPFVAINNFGMSSEAYGTANLLPAIGLLTGSICSAQLSKRYPLRFVIKIGIVIASVGTVLMLVAILLNLPLLFCLFFPLIVIYFGTCLVIANAAAPTMEQLIDKANGAAVMSFVNVGLATTVALNLGFLPIKPLILPIIYLALCGFMIGLYRFLPPAPLIKP